MPYRNKSSYKVLRYLHEAIFSVGVKRFRRERGMGKEEEVRGKGIGEREKRKEKREKRKEKR